MPRIRDNYYVSRETFCKGVANKKMNDQHDEPNKLLGIWKDRSDMKNVGAYIRALRINNPIRNV